MRKVIDLDEHFKMDRTISKSFSTFEEMEREGDFWLDTPVEERYYAVEFLRAQWIALNGFSDKMDRNYFEYR